ncbi:MAG: hypothetical protein KBD26_01370 [Candidatus Pacebacteria bacterium]|nr:hypothetical protein [Candidatus Paceibacterota bacterium]MBP9772459.1 hypothetical protein [Candidatus Paceibacterota bacterium]
MLENPESEENRILREYEELLKDFFERHPDEETPMEMRRDPEAEIENLLKMHMEFESKYSLEELHAIENPKDKNYSKRIEAIEDLKPIVLLRLKIKRETTISKEKYDELFTLYKRLSKAVGMLNNEKVDHS